MLPLEKWLKRQCEIDNDNKTADGILYFDAYNLQKTKFETNLYPYIPNGLTSFNPDPTLQTRYEVYTNHGKAHVDDLIRILSRFLNCKNENSELSLTPFEVFILLMAAISHDAGNIFGRHNHQEKVSPLLNDINFKVVSNLEVSIIASIAEAHTGKGLIHGMHPKDTISGLQESWVSGVDKDISPRKLAALIRFCDEICEDNTRTPLILARHQDVASGPSSRYLHYGLSVSSVDINYNDGKINIYYDVDENHILKKIKSTDYHGREDNYYLFDEIIHRIKKIKIEMDYCFPFIPESQKYKQVEAIIRSSRSDETKYLKFFDLAKINLSYRTYPSGDVNFGIDMRENTGTRMRQKVKSDRASRGAQ